MATSSQYGAFVPSNWIWDIQQLQQIQDVSPELKELLVRLYQNLNLMANVINVKDTAQYPTMEMVNGQLWFPNPANNSSTVAVPTERQVLRKVINFGALPNAGTKSVAHGITVTANTTWTRIYGASTNPSTNGIPIPNVDATNSVAINVDATNVNITTITNLSAYTTTYCVLEYLQS